MSTVPLRNSTGCSGSVVSVMLALSATAPGGTCTVGSCGVAFAASTACPAIQWTGSATGTLGSFETNGGFFSNGNSNKSLDYLYVGDSYIQDVLGARGSGLHPVLIDRAGTAPRLDVPVIASLPDLFAVIDQGLDA